MTWVPEVTSCHPLWPGEGTGPVALERKGQWPWPDPQCPEGISVSPWCIPVPPCAKALCWVMGVTPALSGCGTVVSPAWSHPREGSPTAQL